MDPLLPAHQPLPPGAGEPLGGLAITTTSATTYAALYGARTDPLNGDYGPWLAGHAAVPAVAPATVRANMLSTADTVAKVYLILVPGPGGVPVVKTLFRPQLYPVLPGVATPWDDQVFAFGTDLGPGNQITTVRFPGDAFHLSTPNVWAPDGASMAEALGAAPEEPTLGPYEENAPNTIVTRSRKLMAVPHQYVSLVLGTTQTPKELWIRLSTAIFADNRGESCAPLITWLILALTCQQPVDGQAPRSPLLQEALVAPVPDHALAQHRWGLVVMDMPQLAGVIRTQDQAIMHAVEALRQANIQQTTAAQLERTEARAPKLPSVKFPATVNALMRVTGTTTELGLPTWWHDYANCSKAEGRVMLVNAFMARARMATAASPTSPLITKELLDCYTQHKLASPNPDDLEDGLQLFKFVPGPEDHNQKTRIRNDLYDQLQAGDAAPSISDVRELASNKLFLPWDQFTLTTALQHHSLALDVYLGPQHPVCELYRTWIREGWIRQEPNVRLFIAQFYTGHPATAYTRFARWISLRMNAYLLELTNRGIDARLPNFDMFAELISTRQNVFPPIPERYLTAPTPPRPSPVPGYQPPDRRELPVPITGTPEQPGSGDRGSNRDLNPRPVQEIVQAFRAIGLTVKKCYNVQAPPTGQNGPICLTWQATDGCFMGCGKARSHKPLNSTDKPKLISYCHAVAAAGGPAE
jgi:hypothetical protein